MTFQVYSFTITNGARFVGDQLIVSLMVITTCSDIPYLDKFLQYDNIDLELDPNTTPVELILQLPILVNNWVSQNYPNT